MEMQRLMEESGVESQLESSTCWVVCKVLRTRMEMQALRAGQLQSGMLAAQPKAGRPGLSTVVLDEADLMLSMPGYEADLRDIIPKVQLGYHIPTFLAPVAGNSLQAT